MRPWGSMGQGWLSYIFAFLAGLQLAGTRDMAGPEGQTTEQLVNWARA